jgi:putative ABC transport system permease protein
MKLFRLIFKNAFRHKFRAILTIIGIGIAVIAFGVLRTVVTAWNSGVQATNPDRLVVRQSVSFIFPLPYSYRDKILGVNGVETASYANWFGGTYIDKKNFFARMAVDANTFFNVYPEFVLTKTELDNFQRERNSCVIGRDIAKKFKLKIGDIMTLDGDIFPGKWEFVVRGIYQPKYKTTDATQMYFRWDYLNERMLKETPERGNEVGWYIVKISKPEMSASISESIDNIFKNSPAETKTETENAFQQGFISSSSAIINGMNFMSFTIVAIIMLVLANTMMMSARERTREYAILKTIGFSVPQIASLIIGESFILSALGGALGLALTIPIISGLATVIPTGMFPVFQIEPITIVLLIAAVAVVGIASAIFPVRRAAITKIVDGLRFVG